MNPAPSVRHTTRLKIAFIGPIAPYRGGIAHYTAELFRALPAYCDVHMFSFKRLYPMWLYPGKSDKEPSAADAWLRDVSYTIDIYNPLTLRGTADVIIHEGCEVAIISWWTLIWQPGLAVIARQLRRHGVKVIYLCHNLTDHDDGTKKNGGKTPAGLKTRLAHSVAGTLKNYTKKLLTQADGYIVHAAAARDVIKALKPDAAILQRLHPIYGKFPAADTQLPKRGRLELLFFGLVRPYKGLDLLVRALAGLQDKDVYLTVAGEAWGDVAALRQQLEAMAAPNVELHLEYIDAQTAANYFTRADVVVLPYRSATGSGVLADAYHYGCPVLATRVGGLPESIVEGNTGWVVDPDSPEALAKAIAGIRREQLPAMAGSIEAFCAENSWDAMAKEICDLAGRLVAQQ